MLNQNKKLSKKTIATLIAGVIILALLIVLTSTGAVHQSLDCRSCNDHGVMIECTVCDEDTVDECELCHQGELVLPAGWTVCGDCDGTGFVDGEVCETCLLGDKLGYGHFVKCGDCGGETVVQGSFWA